MASSVTFGLNTIIFKLDGKDTTGVAVPEDVTGMMVWCSTSTASLPASTAYNVVNQPSLTALVYSGKGFSTTIQGLAANTVHYIKYAYISDIDPYEFTISSLITTTTPPASVTANGLQVTNSGNTVLYDSGDGVYIRGNATTDNYSVGDTSTGQVGTAYGTSNLAIGANALKTSGSSKADNIGIGSSALNKLTGSASSRNIAIGKEAMSAAVSAVSCVAIGTGALKYGTSNVVPVIAIGSSALSRQTDGGGGGSVGNVHIGNYNDDTSNQSVTLNNIHIGGYSGLARFGDRSTHIGCDGGISVSASSATTDFGVDNVTIGYGAGSYAFNSNNNVIIGAGAEMGSGSSNNTIVGAGVGNITATGGSNIILGYGAAGSLSTGNNNILIGNGAGGSITTGSNNVILGSYLGASSSTNNSISIADGAGNLRLQWLNGILTWEMGGSLKVLSGVYAGDDNTNVFLRPETVDGTDTCSAALMGAPGSNVNRAGLIFVYGNEHATHPGKVRLIPGTGATGTNAISIEGDTTLTTGNFYNVGGIYTGSTNVFLRPSTTDGTDTASAIMAGGGATGTNRGGQFNAYGNENTSFPGMVRAIPGTGATGANAISLEGNVTIDSALTVTGGQIVFPATQNASANANTLDDYEEGTFSTAPAIVGTTTAGTGTYSVQIGRYTKIGNRCMFNIIIVYSAHTGTGNFRITNLPFTSPNVTNLQQAVTVNHSQITSPASTVIQGFVRPNSTDIDLYSVAVAGAAEAALAIDTNGGTIRISGQYETA